MGGSNNSEIVLLGKIFHKRLSFYEKFYQTSLSQNIKTTR